MKIEEIAEWNIRIFIVVSFLVKYETTIIPPETNIEEIRLRITPSISETVDGRVIRYTPEKPNKTSEKFLNFGYSLLFLCNLYKSETQIKNVN